MSVEISLKSSHNRLESIFHQSWWKNGRWLAILINFLSIEIDGKSIGHQLKRMQAKIGSKKPRKLKWTVSELKTLPVIPLTIDEVMKLERDDRLALACFPPTNFVEDAS